MAHATTPRPLLRISGPLRTAAGTSATELAVNLADRGELGGDAALSKVADAGEARSPTSAAAAAAPIGGATGAVSSRVRDEGNEARAVNGKGAGGGINNVDEHTPGVVASDVRRDTSSVLNGSSNMNSGAPPVARRERAGLPRPGTPEAAVVKKREMYLSARASALMRRMTEAGKRGRCH